MFSKVNGFYPKICPAIGLTKINMFLRTNVSVLQSKLGPFSESSDQGLSGRQPQNKSVSKDVGLYCRFK